jgi:hypothetical protein
LLDHLTALRDLTGEEVAQVGKFYEDVAAAMEFTCGWCPAASVRAHSLACGA